VAVAALQVIPLVRGRGEARVQSTAPRTVVSALVGLTGVLLVLVVALVWYGATYLLPPPKGEFDRAPYLTRVTASEADFSWQAAGGRAVELRAGAPGEQTVTARSGRLTGLAPGTRYTWTANIGGVSAAAGAFTTAPDASSSAHMRLVAFGDYGSGNAHEYAVGRLAAAADPNLFLSAGDNAYLLASPPLLDRAIFRPLHALLGEAMPVITLGEHDLAWNDGSAVISAFHLPGHHYTVQYGPVQVVVLGLQADASATSFARKTLGRCAQPCPVRFVLVHRPIDAANPIMLVLRSHGVAAILAAHLHRYERHDRAHVLQFTLGTGGEGPGSAQFTRATPDALVSFLAYGFLQIDVGGGRIDYRFIDETGRVRDEVSQTIP
jgi:hypothetical protein